MSSSNHDTKGDMKARVFMSFLIFGFLFLLSVAICLKVVALNPEKIADEFVSYEYVSGYNQSVNTYVDDICKVNGIDSKGINDILSYDFCKKVVEQYVGGILGNNKGYIDTTAKSTIDDTKSEIAAQIETALSGTDYKLSEKKVSKISNGICDYMLNQLSKLKLDMIKSITSVGSIASSVAVGAFAVLIAVSCLITYFIGVKRYRSLRAVACSFMSAGWLDILISIMVVIISKIKTVDIFPLYLQNTFMSYFSDCIKLAVICGVSLILAAYTIAAVIWLQKKKLK